MSSDGAGQSLRASSLLEGSRVGRTWPIPGSILK